MSRGSKFTFFLNNNKKKTERRSICIGRRACCLLLGRALSFSVPHPPSRNHVGRQRPPQEPPCAVRLSSRCLLREARPTKWEAASSPSSSFDVFDAFSLSLVFYSPSLQSHYSPHRAQERRTRREARIERHETTRKCPLWLTKHSSKTLSTSTSKKNSTAAPLPPLRPAPSSAPSRRLT